MGRWLPEDCDFNPELEESGVVSNPKFSESSLIVVEAPDDETDEE